MECLESVLSECSGLRACHVPRSTCVFLPTSRTDFEIYVPDHAGPWLGSPLQPGGLVHSSIEGSLYRPKTTRVVICYKREPHKHDISIGCFLSPTLLWWNSSSNFHGIVRVSIPMDHQFFKTLKFLNSGRFWSHFPAFLSTRMTPADYFSALQTPHTAVACPQENYTSRTKILTQ